ncbi:MAG: hypothetical protein IPO79_02940 [Flavobacteriales bacterium]|nr:hypothetical protein [Flavobacteriales bacterium]
MKIPLDRLEEVIDARIVQRGLKYYEDGAVDEPEEIEADVFEALVQGSDDYTVRVRLKGDAIIEHECDCPYDLGPVCKHVVALIFHLQNEQLGNSGKAQGAKAGKKNSTPRKPTVAEQVESALAAAPQQELIAFVRARCMADAAFRKDLLVACAPRSISMDRRDHLRTLRSEMHAIAGRKRFIDYHEATEAGGVLYDMLDQAKQLVQKGHPERALPMLTAAIEAGAEAIQDADDSNGEIGGGIEMAMQLLADLARKKHKEPFRQELLSETHRLLTDKTVMDCDWNGTLEPIAATLVRTVEEAAPVIAALKRTANSDFGGSAARDALLDLTRRFKGDAAAKALEDGFLVHTDVRDRAIEAAIKAKDWSRAKQLAEDGKRVTRNGRPAAHEHYWTPHLLRIAQRTKDKPEVLRLARILLIDSHHNSMEHYKLLRKEVPTAEWPTYVDKLLKDLRSGKRGHDRSLIADICAAEQRWDEVMAEARKEADIPYLIHSVLDEYEAELGKRYPQEVATTLAERAEYFASKMNPKRDDYLQATKLLRRIKKLGDQQLVDALTADWRVRLARRKGLMEQLNKL